MHEYLIIGAGCEGLALLEALLDEGVDRESILLLDQRTAFRASGAYRFFGPRHHDHENAVTWAWRSWQVHTDDGDVHRACPDLELQFLPVAEHQERAFRRVSRSPNVSVRLGERIDRIDAGARGVVVQTENHAIHASHVFDTRPLPERFMDPFDGEITLRRSVGGGVVRFERPVLDPHAALLFDFRVMQDEGVRYVSVLPFRDDEAWIESIHLTPTSEHPAPASHGLVLRTYLQDVLGSGTLGALHTNDQITSTRRDIRSTPGITYAGSVNADPFPCGPAVFPAALRTAKQLARCVSYADPIQRSVFASPARRTVETMLFRAVHEDPGAFVAQVSTLFASAVPGDLEHFFSHGADTNVDERILGALEGGTTTRRRAA